jgi:hypothetical protein
MHRIGTAVFLLLICWTSSAARAQVKGEVESIGFSSLYRPDCWTPMVVRLRPESGETGTYQIHVVQEDLDRDRAIYSRTVTLTGNSEGQGVREQRYWMYFIPQPTTAQNIHGLPDAADGLKMLQEKLKVFVTNADGTKQISQLPLTATINKVDGFRSEWAAGRGTKMILVVSDPDSGSQAMSRDYSPPENILGLQEDVAMIPVAPADLPEDPRGYDAIDAIVLLHVDPASLKLPTDERMRALRQYVSTGGRLVICQLPESERMTGYGDLLPVTFPQYGEGDAAVQGNLQSDTLGPLRTLARAQEDSTWDRLKGPVRLGVAEAKSNAIVDEWITWGDSPAPLPPRSPYIVRSVYGTGSVTWVAQDLGDPAVVRNARTGWSHVWDRVFDWKEEPLVLTNATPKEDKDPYAISAGVELGRALLNGMEHGQKGATMVFVAVVFFVAYWVLAGPVAYVVLLKQDRARLSWFVFGASAFAATLVTALVVKVALSGDAEIRHTTVVRSGQATPAVADARIGLYIPKDGPQRIALKQTAPDFVSHITPFPIHPQFATGNDYPAYLDYNVPVRDATAEAPPSVDIPYRRTLKKVQAHWVGLTDATLEGSAELRPSDEGYITGTLTNVTGHNLVNVYVAFKFPVADGLVQDWVLYVPKLAKGGTIDLAQEWKASSLLPPDLASVERLNKPVRGIIGQAGRELQWDGYWHRLLRSSSGLADNQFADLPRSFPILSLFERIPPSKINNEYKNRFEMMRRGARKHDLSHCLAAGGLVVVAQADETPLPFPLEVQGSLVAGTGTTFYQAVIPLKRTQAEAAATQPVALNN